MPGPYTLALSRAQVTADGVVLGTGTVTLRDGVATLKVGPTVVATLTVTGWSAEGRRAWTIQGEGSTWQVKQGCGCGR